MKTSDFLNADVVNKAHTATLNRICQRYGVEPSEKADFDIKTDGLIIEVETTASIQEAVERLREQRGPVYIAITNKEGLKLAKLKPWLFNAKNNITHNKSSFKR